MNDWKRDELFLLFSRRTNRKDKENYIVNAIWHKLNNVDLQPVTQQCVLLGNGKRYLIDLYFPQIHYGIECDEGYHKNNTFNDLRRAENIRQILSAVSISEKFVLKRIDATSSLERINNSIEEVVKEIQERVEKLSNPLEWKSVQERIEDVIERKMLTVYDLIPFPNTAAVAPCFGRYPKKWRSSCVKLDEQYKVWFPQLALKNGDLSRPASEYGWLNTISDDWSIIEEYNEKDEDRSLNLEKELLRVTFTKSKDVYGKQAYRFVGVFKPSMIRDGKVIYKRMADRIDLRMFL